MHYALMFSGIVFSALSIISFALGWEMWRDSLKNGSLIGMVEIKGPEVKIDVLPKIKLAELDGLLIDEKFLREANTFLFTAIKPGQYLLDIEGEFIECPTKTVNIFPSRDSDIGKITCSLNENRYWNELFSHSRLNSSTLVLNSTLIAEDNTIWATGFRVDNKFHNSYVLFHNVTNKWIEVVVPEVNGAKRGSSLYQFETGEICLGTNGKVGVISRDNGVSWEKIDLPPDVSSINLISELPGNKWLIFGRRIDVIYDYDKTLTDKPQCAIFISEDHGKNWILLSEHPGNISTYLRHSSGRLIVGTESVFGDAGLFYSEDGGKSWERSKISNNVILRGLGGITELKDGTLLAGTLDGKKWGNTHLNGREFLKGGRILKSENGGKSWVLSAGDNTWESVKVVIQLADLSLIAAEGGNLMWSINNGDDWFHFGKSQNSLVNQIIELDSEIIVSGNHEIIKSPKEKLIINFLENNN